MFPQKDSLTSMFDSLRDTVTITLFVTHYKCMIHHTCTCSTATLYLYFTPKSLVQNVPSLEY